MWGKEAKPVLKGANGRTKEDISWVKGIQPDRYLAVKLKKYDDCKMSKETSILAQIESFWLPAASFESSGNRKGKSIRFSLPMCRQPSIILTSTKILTTHTLLHLQGNRATGHEATNTSINSEMGGLCNRIIIPKGSFEKRLLLD